ncbi:MAG: GNAT family N-acetyltransferase [Anaerolineae bacterium]
MTHRKVVYTFKTKNGVKVKVYQVLPQDAASLVNLFEHLSTTSRYYRFREPLATPDPEVVWRTAQQMASVNPTEGIAFLAFADLPDERHAPIAGARYIHLPDHTGAEVSIAVRDDLQRQGIATELLNFISNHARAAGIKRLIAGFSTTNRAVWRLVQNAPFAVVTEIYGPETEAAFDLDQPVDKETARVDR